jgi:hypothetical protein
LLSLAGCADDLSEGQRAAGGAPRVVKGERLADTNDPRYRITLPAGFKGTASAYQGLFKVCVSREGAVRDVTVTESSGEPAVDAHWMQTIYTWPYRPYRIDGRPLPFCHPLKLNVKIDSSVAEAPTPTSARLIPPEVGARLRAADVTSDPRYKPGLPPELQRAGTKIWGIYKLCVDREGKVTGVSSVKPADQEGAIDQAWKKLMATWPHLPYVTGGVAYPYCYPMRLEVAIQ